jgi:hypothetical protein
MRASTTQLHRLANSLPSFAFDFFLPPPVSHPARRTVTRVVTINKSSTSETAYAVVVDNQSLNGVFTVRSRTSQIVGLLCYTKRL